MELDSTKSFKDILNQSDYDVHNSQTFEAGANLGMVPKHVKHKSNPADIYNMSRRSRQTKDKNQLYALNIPKGSSQNFLHNSSVAYAQNLQLHTSQHNPTRVYDTQQSRSSFGAIADRNNSSTASIKNLIRIASANPSGMPLKKMKQIHDKLVHKWNNNYPTNF